MKYYHPLISCICITGYRHIVLQRALTCFERQDYPYLEIVISYPENDLDTKKVIEQFDRISSIKILKIEHPAEQTKILTQNNALNLANGEFICIWNDQDWHHVNRISDQYRVIKEGPFKASILMHILIYDSKHKRSYHSNYLHWIDTLLCEKEVMLQASYVDIQSNIDHSILHFLACRNLLYQICGVPHLYIYILNENDRSEFIRNHLLQCEKIDDINQIIEEIIDMNYYLTRYVVEDQSPLLSWD